jgi:hypothetical protein
VIKPVHDAFPDDSNQLRNGTRHHNSTEPYAIWNGQDHLTDLKRNNSSWFGEEHGVYKHFNTDYLWMYVVFAYLFTALAMYLLVTETQRIIAIRQEYLGSQVTVTDRTIRLSGIPPSLRSEEKIKNFIEHLQIGKVDKVMLCREWQDLDNKMAERMTVLRKLEESWTVFLGHRRVERSLESLPIVQPPPPVAAPYQDEEGEEEANGERRMNGVSHGPLDPRLRTRPMLTLRSGPLGIHGRKVDAIDHYEEKLKEIDDAIRDLRTKEYKPTSMAFVTLDSVAACVSTADSCRAFDIANCFYSKWPLKLCSILRQCTLLRAKVLLLRTSSGATHTYLVQAECLELG